MGGGVLTIENRRNIIETPLTGTHQQEIIMKKIIGLPQLAWHGVKNLDITLPPDWQAQVCNMAGFDKPHLTPAAIKKTVASPLGMPPLRQYARGKKEVVILFDDMSRVTRTAEIIPHVLAELAEAGIEDKQIRFICAGGSHGALDRADFIKKLGEDVLKRFPVYNHHAFDSCVYTGTTSSGIKLSFNAEAMKCDLKIGIGSVVPHIMAGFSGGGKIILPGIASYETVLAFHSPRQSAGSFGSTVTGMGVVEDNPRRKDIDEAAVIAGLDIKIDALVNLRGETAELYAGAPREEHAAALKSARMHYLTPFAPNMDIVLANTFAKASEAVSGLSATFASVKTGGDIVLIANAPEGQTTHYLMGPFGNSAAGKLPIQMNVPDRINRLIVFNEYPELASARFFASTAKIIMTDKWDEVMALLKQNHGPGTKAAVYPNADIQYFRMGDSKS
jgi:lactate racemase